MMVLLVCLGCVALIAGVSGYLVIGRNRYGGKRAGRPLELGASQSALSQGVIRPEPCRTIRVYFIKPSRYDENGYVQFFRYGVQPNNTLTVLAALNDTFNKRYSAARNVYLQTVLWDEICDGAVSPETIVAIKEKAREDGVELLIGLSGVQSNQYPRGRDLALQFVAHGLPTMMGGFHVSGYPESVKFLNNCGITTVVGEAENLWGQIIEDFLRGELQLHYSVTEGIRAKTGQEDIIVPLITDAQLPVIDDRYLTRFFNEAMTTIDTSRGCPFTCSYCSVKNVMGRTMRSREPEAVRALGTRRDPLPRYRIAVLGRRRLLPQSAMGGDPDRPGRGQEGVPAAELHDAGRRRRLGYANVARGRDRGRQASAQQALRRPGGARRMLPGVRRYRVAQSRQPQLRHQVPEHRRPPASDEARRVRARACSRSIAAWSTIGIASVSPSTPATCWASPSTAPIADGSRPGRCARSASTSCRSSS